mmetsp:Transcript_117921/g.338163  ORF Transcript_117921/g.338163 Transcript_117921/m.338163 type:complete len:312 (-) Transcript_117921:1029-1964(-)
MYRLSEWPWSLPAYRTCIGGIAVCTVRPCSCRTATTASSTRDICTRAAHVGCSGSGLSRSRSRTTLPYCSKMDCSKKSGKPTGQPLTYRLLLGFVSVSAPPCFDSANRTVIGWPSSAEVRPLRPSMAYCASWAEPICTKAATSGTVLPRGWKGNGNMRHHFTVPYRPNSVRSWSVVLVQCKPLTYKWSSTHSPPRFCRVTVSGWRQRSCTVPDSCVRARAASSVDAIRTRAAHPDALSHRSTRHSTTLPTFEKVACTSSSVMPGGKSLTYRLSLGGGSGRSGSLPLRSLGCQIQPAPLPPQVFHDQSSNHW